MPTPSFALLIAFVLILAFLAVLAAKLKPRDGLFSKPWPIEAKRQLLTEHERALYPAARPNLAQTPCPGPGAAAASCHL